VPGNSATPVPRDRTAAAAWHHRAWRPERLFVIALSVVAAVAIDWLLAPNGYPVAAAYGISLLLAAQLLASPTAVAATGGIAFALSIASNMLQRAPLAALAADNAGLLAMSFLALLLARQTKVADAARQRLELQYGAARALAEGPTLQAASTAILGAIARHLGWARGALWYVDEPASALRCIATWREAGVDPDPFDEQTRTETFARGVGLPGRVWADGRSLWIPDIENETEFPRRAAATKAALHAALAVPVCHREDILGVVEFFSSDIQQPDEELLALMQAVGTHLGLFLARRRAEDQVAELLEREQAPHLQTETAVRMRDAFLGSVSHDLRGPLTAIRGYAQLARRQAPEVPNSETESGRVLWKASIRWSSG
jgi:hypothetical protein